jgi:hypothetical protein
MILIFRGMWLGMMPFQKSGSIWEEANPGQDRGWPAFFQYFKTHSCNVICKGLKLEDHTTMHHDFLESVTGDLNKHLDRDRPLFTTEEDDSALSDDKARGFLEKAQAELQRLDMADAAASADKSSAQESGVWDAATIAVSGKALRP